LIRLTTRLVILAAILVSLLSFAKFEHCQSIGWSQPGTDVHECYTDISALFGERALNTGQWAYSSPDNAVEYPVLQGTIMWLTAKVAAGDINKYYYINIGLIALLFIGSALALNKIKPELNYLYLFAPTSALALFINWDLWAIVTMLLAIYWFDRKRYLLSATIMAISIATKFFPIVLLMAVGVIFIRNREYRKLIQYFSVTIGLYLLINLPYAITTPKGWWRFFDMNIHRLPDWGSLWLGIEIYKIHIAGFNYISLLAILLPVLALLFFLFSTVKVLSLAESSIFFLAIVMTFGKVYSPQYVLWLTPLVVIALVNSKEKLSKTLTVFWFWQITEIIYHVAIWTYLAGHGTEHHLIPRATYGLAIFIRIVGIVAMTFSLARQHRLESSISLKEMEASRR
jgi:uncharacterized membrane protein